MLPLRATALALVLAVAAFAAAPVAAESHVRVLGSDNFDRLTAKGTWLVEFYAPWCGHCKRLAPVYEQVAAALVGEVDVAKCDATVERGLAARFPIGGYPALYVINGTRVFEYDGGRTKEAIAAFARKGWTQATALSFFQSPFSAIGKAKGYLIATGALLLDAHAYLQSAHGFTPVSAGLVVGACVLVTMMGVMFLVLSYTAPAPQPRRRAANNNNANPPPRNDANPAAAGAAAPQRPTHPHQD